MMAETELESQSSNPPVNNVDLIREKIKAARLEKLMAHQLANELHIEATGVEEVAITTEPANSQSIEPTADTDIDALVSRVNETTRDVSQFLAESGCGSDEGEEAQAIAASTKTPIQESNALVEKQQKQIAVLKQLRAQDDDHMAALRLALGQLEELNRKQDDALGQSRTHINDLFKTVDLLNDELEGSDRKRRRLQSRLDEMHLQSKQQSEELVQATSELSALQNKHTDLNKHCLEQQNKHYTRMKTVEEQLREARKEIELLAKQKLEMQEELAANHKLLELQDEMIATLSDGKSEKAA